MTKAARVGDACGFRTPSTSGSGSARPGGHFAFFAAAAPFALAFLDFAPFADFLPSVFFAVAAIVVASLSESVRRMLCTRQNL